ncbi:WXG100 family type VII secretion target [Streptomyces sp. KL116D]|uniref:WXG100 family type VII secretion target n=1 Tax=Streptomyces sp. KL116D TaxID=3045152 RepID=UPI003555C642
MPESPDYDTSVLSIDPRLVEEISKALLALADQMVDHIEAVADAAFHLELSWAGDTAQEAKRFMDRWNGVMRELFGSKKHPEDGVLNVMAGTVHVVAAAFSQTEASLEKVFRDFADNLPGGTKDLQHQAAQALSGDAPSTPTSAPPDVPEGLDPQDSAVVEDFFN